ncbi:hypothetical protein KIW84_045199 [Lathyrus oleraceus]|uniref:K Homology domain-containing protein n=1 Tax=Pisum sativum TaxID=3888 RepID=A0A9D4XIH5_PEA|nr:hypothetical protein KIW84_045199 [Pisum sativum]
MICHLVGTSDAVASAEKLINEVLAEAEAGASAGGGTRRMAAQSGGDEFSMQIPNNKVGLIIGKGGETIKSMQASTGARIQITFNVKHQLRMEDRIWIQLQSGSEFRCGGFSENRRMYYLGFELISEFASVPNWGGLPRLILALLISRSNSKNSPTLRFRTDIMANPLPSRHPRCQDLQFLKKAEPKLRNLPSNLFAFRISPVTKRIKEEDNDR